MKNQLHNASADLSERYDMLDKDLSRLKVLMSEAMSEAPVIADEDIKVGHLQILTTFRNCTMLN